MSAHWIPEELLKALAVAPGDPRWEVKEIDCRPDHPMRAHLDLALNSIPPEAMEDVLTDPHCEGWIRFHGAPSDSRQARLEILLTVIYQVLYERRSAMLRQVIGRSAPYDHPALAELLPDDDLLVMLNAFDLRLGYLQRGGFVFSLPPPLPQLNSHYWSMQALLRLPERASVRIRLDPLLVSPADSYRTPFYRMLVFGRELDWDRIAQLKTEESARWMPDELTTADCEFTDLTWRRRDDAIHFECEEIPKSPDQRPSRYFHAIYDPQSECFIHADAAVRYYGAEELGIRRTRHLKDLAKVGTRVKLFRIDGVLEREEWATVLASAFVWNNDLHRYVLGGRDFASEHAHLLPGKRN